MSDSPILEGLRRAAESAGMIDPADVRMVDASAVRLNADGDVMIPAGFFADLRRSKPYLFGLPSGSDVRGLSREDYRAAQDDMLREVVRPGPGYVPPEGFDARTAPRTEFDRVAQEYVRHEVRRAVAGISGRVGPR